METPWRVDKGVERKDMAREVVKEMFLSMPTETAPSMLMPEAGTTLMEHTNANDHITCASAWHLPSNTQTLQMRANETGCTQQHLTSMG